MGVAIAILHASNFISLSVHTFHKDTDSNAWMLLLWILIFTNLNYASTISKLWVIELLFKRAT